MKQLLSLILLLLAGSIFAADYPIVAVRVPFVTIPLPVTVEGKRNAVIWPNADQPTAKIQALEAKIAAAKAALE